MVEASTATTRRFSPRSGLAALGLRPRSLDVFGPIRQALTIAQKTVKHTPAQKLYAAFIALRAGAHGLVEINTRLRRDPALQAACGRAACAEQSVVQQTLDACTPENVAQLEQAVDAELSAAQPGLSARLRRGLAGAGRRHERPALRA